MNFRTNFPLKVGFIPQSKAVGEAFLERKIRFVWSHFFPAFHRSMEYMQNLLCYRNRIFTIVSDGDAREFETIFVCVQRLIVRKRSRRLVLNLYNEGRIFFTFLFRKEDKSETSGRKNLIKMVRVLCKDLNENEFLLFIVTHHSSNMKRNHIRGRDAKTKKVIISFALYFSLEPLIQRLWIVRKF
ncbi:hypothetical protein DLM78_07085 [Leptospira stimsonii]|uniref:Uncharacterized protein n=1 Tax=Leptospira stimsonii TaxID=2202203 RepID=A0A8B3CTU7_9LEPT|nr:hypothetical protein DLM78_07085 [Leptospira stimsonii]